MWFRELVDARRATVLVLDEQRAWWVATERLPFAMRVHPEKQVKHEINIPDRLLKSIDQGKDPLTELIRGRLEIVGPVTANTFADTMSIPVQEVNNALYGLENEGFVFRGKYTGSDELEWCERRLLGRIHRYTIKRLRAEIQPVSAADFMRFLFSWHQIGTEDEALGPGALEHVLLKMEGFEAPAAAWEGDIFPARIRDYDHQWLDVLCISGKVTWGRFRPALPVIKEKKAASPIKTTPIAFISRANQDVWNNAGKIPEELVEGSLSQKARQVLDVLRQQGACFFDDIVNKTKLFASQVEDVLGELIGAGLVTSDSFTGLRALLVPGKYKTNAGRRRNNEIFSMSYAGRWSLLYNENGDINLLEDVEKIAWALLRRYGVVFRKLAERENLAPPWRELARTLRTLEARGQIRGGRFVEGVWGEQFALPEAIVELRKIKKEAKTNVLHSVSAADPLNLTGIITPGRRIPSFSGNRILYSDGVPVAFLEAKEVHFVTEPDKQQKWHLQNALVKRAVPVKLRKYLA